MESVLTLMQVILRKFLLRRPFAVQNSTSSHHMFGLEKVRLGKKGKDQVHVVTLLIVIFYSLYISKRNTKSVEKTL